MSVLLCARRLAHYDVVIQTQTIGYAAVMLVNGLVLGTGTTSEAFQDLGKAAQWVQLLLGLVAVAPGAYAGGQLIDQRAASLRTASPHSLEQQLRGATTEAALRIALVSTVVALVSCGAAALMALVSSARFVMRARACGDRATCCRLVG